MDLKPPEWLTRHEGALCLMPDRRSWSVVFAGAPQYRLEPIPAEGKYSVRLVECVSGKRLDQGKIYAAAEEALHGGLEELRQALGW